jgi:hypothetical protein
MKETIPLFEEINIIAYVSSLNPDPGLECKAKGEKV